MFSETVRYEEHAIVIDFKRRTFFWVTWQNSVALAGRFLSFHNYVSQLFSSGSHSSLDHFTLNILRIFLALLPSLLLLFFNFSWKRIQECFKVSRQLLHARLPHDNTFNTVWYIANRSIKTKRICQVNINKSMCVCVCVCVIGSSK